MSSVSVGAVFVLATAAANVFQKKGMSRVGAVRALDADLLVRLATTSWVWAGMAAYAVALGAWLVLLSRVPLHVATSIAALNFVAVILASRLVLGEPIPLARWFGFACILAGVWIVSRPGAGAP